MKKNKNIDKENSFDYITDEKEMDLQSKKFEKRMKKEGYKFVSIKEEVNNEKQKSEN